MHLRSITLRQFRSYRHLELDLDDGVHLFIGQNGSGKTNLLEAIAVLTTGSSPRGAEPENMVLWGENGFAILGQFSYDSAGRDPLTLEMKYRSGVPRVIRENGQTVVRLKDLMGRVPLVSFVPEDLAMVKGEPEQRRQALNMALLQVDGSYAEALRRYSDVLKARNAALKQLAEGLMKADALEPWDQALIQAGITLCNKRASFLSNFRQPVARIHRRITNGKETLDLEYKPSFAGPWDESAKERWNEQLKRVRPQETVLGTTLSGPHRDDIVFNLNGRLAKSFGSEGQKRTCAVAFKLAEVSTIYEATGQRPLCLLDDVLSELDAERAERLLDELSQTGQCFVTLTGLESWPRHRALPASIFRVDARGLTPERRTAFLSLENISAN